jgi:hypothetical protein
VAYEEAVRVGGPGLADEREIRAELDRVNTQVRQLSRDLERFLTASHVETTRRLESVEASTTALADLVRGLRDDVGLAPERADAIAAMLTPLVRGWAEATREQIAEATAGVEQRMGSELARAGRETAERVEEFEGALLQTSGRLGALREAIEQVPARIDGAVAVVRDRLAAAVVEELADARRDLAAATDTQTQAISVGTDAVQRSVDAALGRMQEHRDEMLGRIQQQREEIVAALQQQREEIVARIQTAGEEASGRAELAKEQTASVIESAREGLAGVNGQLDALGDRLSTLEGGLTQRIETSTLESSAAIEALQGGLGRLVEATDRGAADSIERLATLAQRVDDAERQLRGGIETLRGSMAETVRAEVEAVDQHAGRRLDLAGEDLILKLEAARVALDARLEATQAEMARKIEALQGTIAAIEETAGGWVDAAEERLGARVVAASAEASANVEAVQTAVATLGDRLLRNGEDLTRELPQTLAGAVEAAASRTSDRLGGLEGAVMKLREITSERVDALAGQVSLSAEQSAERATAVEAAAKTLVTAGEQLSSSLDAGFERELDNTDKRFAELEQRVQMIAEDLAEVVGSFERRVDTIDELMAKRFGEAISTAVAEVEAVSDRAAKRMTTIQARLLGGLRERDLAIGEERDRELVTLLSEALVELPDRRRGPLLGQLRSIVERRRAVRVYEQDAASEAPLDDTHDVVQIIPEEAEVVIVPPAAKPKVRRNAKRPAPRQKRASSGSKRSANSSSRARPSDG